MALKLVFSQGFLGFLEGKHPLHDFKDGTPRKPDLMVMRAAINYDHARLPVYPPAIGLKPRKIGTFP